MNIDKLTQYLKVFDWLIFGILATMIFVDLITLFTFDHVNTNPLVPDYLTKTLFIELLIQTFIYTTLVIALFFIIRKVKRFGYLLTLSISIILIYAYSTYIISFVYSPVY